mgnify:CR=1 FL=1
MKTPSNHLSHRNFILKLEPAPVWISLLVFVFFSTILIVVGGGKVLNLTFPVISFFIGIFFYFRYPIAYVSFVWWMWFLTPLVRRLADWTSGFTEPSPILLAPLLVTLISSITLILRLPKSYKYNGLPFLCCLASVFYGFLIGLIQNSTVTTITDFLGWVSPIFLGFHLFASWQDYPQYCQSIKKIFFWGVLVMGVYGIYQYLVAPDWDRLWLNSIDVVTFGNPEPLGIRVWSTMHSPQPFAAAMMAGLILLFTGRGNLRYVAAGVGYLSFLLSLARSGWLSWLVGMLIFFSSLKASLQMRLIISIVIASLVVIPLITIEPFSSVISSRLESVSDFGDGSLQGRLTGYENFVGLVLTQFLGKGLGSEMAFGMGSRDSGILTMLYSLGWVGTIPYLAGIVLLLLKTFQVSQRHFDPFVTACLAISVGSLAQIGFNVATSGIIGTVLWGFLGMAMAANKYYLNERIEKKNLLYLT